MLFNSSVLIKSNNTFILSGLLINDLYFFLTPLFYSINAIEYTNDEQLTLSKKMKVFKYNLFVALVIRLY